MCSPQNKDTPLIIKDIFFHLEQNARPSECKAIRQFDTGCKPDNPLPNGKQALARR
jgi:hypothetical protein